MSAGPDAGFDVRAYVRTPIDVRPRDVDLDAVTGLSPAVLDAIEHLWSVERSILDLLRDLLVTPTHAEGRVTAFLNTWAYEQFWVAQSLAAILEANGVEPADPHDTLLGAALRTWDDRLGHTVIAIRTNLLGEEIVASHLVLGWLETSVMAACYARLAALDPRLAPFCEAVAPIKERHLAYFADDARTRLAHEGARTFARRAARAWRWPGSRYGGRTGVRSAVVTLFASPTAEPRLRAIDAGMGAFPGLAGLRPVRDALGRLAR